MEISKKIWCCENKSGKSLRCLSTLNYAVKVEENLCSISVDILKIVLVCINEKTLMLLDHLKRKFVIPIYSTTNHGSNDNSGFCWMLNIWKNVIHILLTDVHGICHF